MIREVGGLSDSGGSVLDVFYRGGIEVGGWHCIRGEYKAKKKVSLMEVLLVRKGKGKRAWPRGAGGESIERSNGFPDAADEMLDKRRKHPLVLSSSYSPRIVRGHA